MTSSDRRPPYRVPSMDEVREVEPNGFTAASLFAGCGGSSLGYRMAGFRVAYANEFIPIAAETYAANASPSTVVDLTDVREVKGRDILDRIGLDVGDLDVLDGSPPCSSFSASGSTSAGWGKAKKYSDTVQRTDDLFDEYIRLVEEMQPKVFVAENVAGLVRGVSKGYFKRIIKGFRDDGYRVAVRLLDASALGVPQARRRLIFVGVREDLGVEPVHPAPLPYRYTLRDLGFAYTEDWAGTGTERPPGAALWRDGVALDPETGSKVSLDGTAIGRDLIRIAPGTSSGRYFNLVRPSLDAPCPTVTQTTGALGAAGVVHPSGRRKMTVAELRLVSGFPADFVLLGDYAKRVERIGRAVPPLMMKAIATTVRKHILEKDGGK